MMSYKTRSDKELAMLLTKDDESAFRELYLRYKDRLWHYSFTLLKSKDECDDLVQEIFIRFWESRFFINPELSISSFLYTMTRNRILNFFRNTDVELRVKTVLAHTDSVEIESIEDDLIFSDYLKIFMNAINKLPPQRKRIFNLSRVEHKSHKEIAAQLGISISTVQEHISESLRFIKIYFSNHTDLTLSVLILTFLY